MIASFQIPPIWPYSSPHSKTCNTWTWKSSVKWTNLNWPQSLPLHNHATFHNHHFMLNRLCSSYSIVKKPILHERWAVNVFSYVSLSVRISWFAKLKYWQIKILWSCGTQSHLLRIQDLERLLSCAGWRWREINSKIFYITDLNWLSLVPSIFIQGLSMSIVL
jgi:hypothetical protein